MCLIIEHSGVTLLPRSPGTTTCCSLFFFSASPTHGNLSSDGSLNGLDSVEDGGDRVGLRENVMLEGQSSRIQDDETLELQDSTQFHENGPK